MISPLEVQKGSILLHEGKVKRVKAVGDFILFEGTKEWIGGSLVNGEPISVTWLEGLGFRQMDYDTWSDGQLDVVLGEGVFTTNKSSRAYLYVHQL